MKAPTNPASHDFKLCIRVPHNSWLSSAWCRFDRPELLPAAGLVWVWPGAGEAPQVPGFSRPPSGYTVHSEIEVRFFKLLCSALASLLLQHHADRAEQSLPAPLVTCFVK